MKYPVSETGKSANRYIHKSFSGKYACQHTLCGIRFLIGDQKKGGTFFSAGHIVTDFFTAPDCFSRAGRTENKVQAHDIFLPLFYICFYYKSLPGNKRRL